MARNKNGKLAMANRVCSQRKKCTHWTEQEHRLFLLGLVKFGKGHWKSIAQFVVLTKTSTQVGSHAQKYFLNQSNVKRKKRKSIHDITLESDLVSQHVDQHNPEPPVQHFHEVHQAREMTGLQNDKLVLHSRDHQNLIQQQIPEKLQSQELPGFEGNNWLFHYIDQQSLSPPNMQQFPPHTDHHDLAPLPDTIDLFPHHIHQKMLQDLQIQQWGPPSHLQIQQWGPPSHLQNQTFPYFSGYYSWPPK